MERGKVLPQPDPSGVDVNFEMMMPLLQPDIVGVVASLLTVPDLQHSFVRVCKLWNAVGSEIVKGTCPPVVSSLFVLFCEIHVCSQPSLLNLPAQICVMNICEK